MKFTGALAIVYMTLQAGAIPVELKVRDVETTGGNIVDLAATRSGWLYPSTEEDGVKARDVENNIVDLAATRSGWLYPSSEEDEVKARDVENNIVDLAATRSGWIYPSSGDEASTE